MILKNFLPVCVSDILVELWLHNETLAKADIVNLFWPTKIGGEEYVQVKMKVDASDLLYIFCTPEETDLNELGSNRLIGLSTLVADKLKDTDQVVSIKQCAIEYGQNLVLTTGSGVQITFRFEDDCIILK